MSRTIARRAAGSVAVLCALSLRAACGCSSSGGGATAGASGSAASGGEKVTLAGTLPMLVVFLVLGCQIVGGVMAGAVKG